MTQRNDQDQMNRQTQQGKADDKHESTDRPHASRPTPPDKVQSGEHHEEPVQQFRESRRQPRRREQPHQ
jgi:hypothetical protein